MPICKMTGESFEISPKEKDLRKKLKVDGLPVVSPSYRFLELGAFWQHWTLHKRKCDKTAKEIVSVFGDECPYPVWHKDEWVQHADPPSGEVDLEKPIFPQMWSFFQKSAIPHNIGTGNENCEYTDDCWYSKNCYLTHSLLNGNDLRYCYRVFRCKDCMYCVFSNDCELCYDVINCEKSFKVQYSLYSQQCSESAFLFDCRNCNNSMFCWNLRNKKYCYFNEQLTKEEFEKKRKEWDLRSREVYQKAVQEFQKILKEKAWIKHQQLIHCENTSGDYSTGCKDSENCYFANQAQDNVHCVRTYQNKDCLDTFCTMTSDLVYYSSCTQDICYDVRFGYNLMQCKYAEYSAFCFQCEHIFGCAGLVGKKYYIFNKPYTPEEYQKKKQEIIAAMQRTGEYGKFLPGYFAANPYEESLSSFYFPLSKDKAKSFGFRTREDGEKQASSYLPIASIPDHSSHVGDDLYGKIFWDEKSQKPLRIQKGDVALVQKLGVPLPWSYYTQRTQDNYRYMPFHGKMRTTPCSQCARDVQTGWSSMYDSRILCEICYHQEVFG